MIITTVVKNSSDCGVFFFKKLMMNNIDNEHWKDIEGYDGLYQVSDLGRVRSKHSGEWKILKCGKNNNGYLQVGLCKDRKRKCVTVHRLVAQAFIPNDDETKNEINHIDECKQNNRVSNLEYCDRSYNNSYNGLHYRRRHTNYRRNAIKDIYNPELSIAQNLELFRSNGVKCSERTVKQLRKDLGLIGSNSQPVRSKIKKLYNPKMSIAENIEMFKEQGVECSKWTVNQLRRDLGLINCK